MEDENTLEDTLVFQNRVERANHSSACLVIIAGPNIGEKISLDEKRMVIGRQSNVQIPLADSIISRKHAEIIAQPDNQFVICDLDSTNGIYLNEKLVDQAVLKDGDNVRIGSSVLKYVGPGSVEYLFVSAMSNEARMDGVTGIFNRKVFYDSLQHEFQRCRALHEPLALIVIDLDLFRRVNDRLGPAAGEYALRDIASHLKRTVRRTNIFARYGGEELGLILPHTNLQEACIVAEKIRGSVESLKFSFRSHDFSLTVSIGVAELVDGYREANELLAKAHKAVHEAKQRGRNRVCISQA